MLLKSSLSASVKQLHERYQTSWSSLVGYFNTSFVSIYKLAGFLLLTVIVMGMFAYLATSGFYFFSNSWMAPAILNANNEKVIQANLNFLEQEYQLEKMESELISLKKELEHVGFATKTHEEFQTSFSKALDSERSKTANELNAYQKILVEYKNLVAGSTHDSASFRENLNFDLEEQYASHLINREELLRGKQMLNQLDVSGISQQEKFSELQQKTESLKKTVRALNETKSLLGANERAVLPSGTRSTYDMGVLLKEQPFLDSSIAHSELVSKEEALKARISMLDNLVERYRLSVARIRNNPYVRANEQNVTIAFVPYENISSVRANMPVVGCYLEFLACRKVGQIVQVLDGEVIGRHPISGREVRGQMIEVKLKDERWAESRSLIAKRAPFLL